MVIIGLFSLFFMVIFHKAQSVYALNLTDFGVNFNGEDPQATVDTVTVFILLTTSTTFPKGIPRP